MRKEYSIAFGHQLEQSIDCLFNRVTVDRVETIEEKNKHSLR